MSDPLPPQIELCWNLQPPNLNRLQTFDPPLGFVFCNNHNQAYFSTENILWPILYLSKKNLPPYKLYNNWSDQCIDQ